MKKNLLFLHVDSMTQRDYEFMSKNPDYFPGIEMFNKKALSVDKMFATGPVTEMVIPAIFSGKLPLADGGYEYGLKNRKSNLINELKKNDYMIQFISGAYNYSSLYDFNSHKAETIPTWSIDLLWKSFQKNYLSNIYQLNFKNEKNLEYAKSVLLRHYNYFLNFISNDTHYYTKYVFMLNEGNKSKIISRISQDIKEIEENIGNYLIKYKDKILKVSFCEFFYKKKINETLVNLFNKVVWSGKKSEFPFLKIPFLNAFIETPSKQSSNKRIFNIISESIEKNKNFLKAIVVSFYDIHNRNFCSNYLIKIWKDRNKDFENKNKNYFQDNRRLYCLKYFDEELLSFLKKNKNLINDYIVVLTSDHGSVFYNGESPLNSTSLTGSFHDEYLSIPFAVYNKDFEQKKISSLSSSIDIFPIISEILNLQTKDENIHGSSKILNGEKNEYIISEHAHRGSCTLNLSKKIVYIGIRTEKFKYINKLNKHPKDPSKKADEILIDLQKDKEERINLVDNEEQHELLSFFRKIYKSRVKELNLI